MKQIVTMLASLLISVQIFGQSSAVVFSEVGEKFTIYLNGEKKNASPQSNVKITGLTAEFYQARVDFEDPALPDFAETNFAVQRGFEFTYIIKKNKKGEYVMRYYGQTESDAAAAPAAAPQSDVKRVAEVDDTPSAGDNLNINQSIQIQEEPVGGNTTVTQTTTTTTKKQPAAAPAGGNVSMGINVDGVNMGISINATDLGGAVDMNVSEETVITTTTTTTTSTTNQAPAQPAAPPAKPASPRPTTQPAVPAQPVAPAQPVGRCAASMSATSFSKAKDNISSNSFEDSKMTIAKQVTKANCMTTGQIKEVMGLFSFEDSKLEFAKFAYDYCFNQGDYYEVNEAFTFESSIEELNQYLESK
jgi:hypothetical protein